jgi:predicted porin
MTYAAPDVTFLNVNSGSLTAFIPYTGDAGNIFRGTLGTTYLENVGNNDAQRFTYFTPRFAGFQVGVSYARDGLQDTNVQVNTDETLHDIFDVGANYVQSFGDFNVAVSGRWGTAAAPGPNPDIWSAGLNLGFAGFTVGGSYAEQNDAGSADGKSYDAGISYETGPWGFSVTWFHGENEASQAFESGDEELDQYLVGVNYKLAKGVSLGAFGAYLDFDDASDDGSGESTDGSIDGWVIGTGIKVSF